MSTDSDKYLKPIGNVESAFKLLGSDDTDKGKFEETFNIAAQSVKDLEHHATEGDYALEGLTRDEFTDLHSGAQFDFSKLEDEFKKAVSDYMAPIDGVVCSKSLHFCSIVIFKIGPASRTAKKASRDARWKMTVLSAESVVNTIIVATFKQSAPKTAQPKLENNKLILTMKQASLLAISTLSTIVKACALKEHYLLTPLAGSVFCKDDLKHIAKDLNLDIDIVICMINASSQSGGFYLGESDAAAACIASLIATRNAEPKLMNSIVTKTVKQYLNHHKNIDGIRFDILAKYATGGIPKGCTPAELLERMNRVQMDPSIRDYQNNRNKMGLNTVNQSALPHQPTSSKN